MKIIKFGNSGELDPRMWRTFGVSAKDGDGAIGKFGTGLKYAIAVLLREGRHISINTGGVLYEFTAKDADFRGKTFKQCFCNGEELPFTTHLGVEWELWMAYREIASNCMDEGGTIGEAGETTVEADFYGVDHEDVFLSSERKPVYSSPIIDIYNGESSVIYYRGVRVFTPPRTCSTTINIKKADITEDRTLKYEHQVREAIAKATLSDTISNEVLEHLLLHTKDKYEEGAFYDWLNTPPSSALIDMVLKYKKKSVYMLPGLARYVLSAVPEAARVAKNPDSRQQEIIYKASEFLNRISHPVKYPVFVSDDLGHGKLGLADPKTDTIWLSDRVLTMGLKQVASTLLEENIHLLEGLHDETYDMQTYLFDQIVTMGERLTGDIL